MCKINSYGDVIYIINKHPIFLTFKNYSNVLCECEKKGFLSAEITNAIVYDPKISKQRYIGICKYLSELKKEFPNKFNVLKNFSCHEREAQDNPYDLLDSFCNYYNSGKIFAKPYYHLEKSASHFYESKEAMDLFMGIADMRFPIGKKYYFGFYNKTRRNDLFGMRLYIDTETIESTHGNLEDFIVIFKTGLVLKCLYGETTIYYK